MTDNTIFFLVNLIGGLLVLTSYVWGIINFPFHRNLLWGDIGSNLKKIIISSMFTGAIGYLFTFVWFWKIIDSNTFYFGSNFGYNQIILLYSIFLGVSTLWMPFTIKSVISKNILHIYSAKLILLTVAIISIIILYSIMTSQYFQKDLIPYKNYAIFSWILLSIHTIIFDSIIWSKKFNPK